jgi:hypothetical protein
VIIKISVKLHVFEPWFHCKNFSKTLLFVENICMQIFILFGKTGSIHIKSAYIYHTTFLPIFIISFQPKLPEKSIEPYASWDYYFQIKLPFRRLSCQMNFVLPNVPASNRLHWTRQIYAKNTIKPRIYVETWLLSFFFCFVE